MVTSIYFCWFAFADDIAYEEIFFKIQTDCERFHGLDPVFYFSLGVVVKLMFLSFGHEKEAIHAVVIAILEVGPLKPAIVEIQDPELHVTIFRLQKKIIQQKSLLHNEWDGSHRARNNPPQNL